MFADVLKDSGINILNIANNHIAEHGAGCFKNTIATLHSKGLSTIGTLLDGEPEILTLQHGENKICLAGFCDECTSSIDNPGCYASLNEKSVFSTLDRMKAMRPNVIVFVFHWGDEYIHFPSLEQRHLAHRLIDNGADLIVGHHPHVIQPYERYKKGHILYSLGNFCFDDVQSAHFLKGMTALVKIQKGSIQEVSLSGVLVKDMAYTDTLVQPMNKQDFTHFYASVDSKYQKLCTLSDEAYQCIYKQTLKKEHAKERLLMRLNLAKKVIDPRHRHRRQLLKNIFNYLK